MAADWSRKAGPETFTEIGAAFEADHPGVRVRFSFAGSPTLAQQIAAGAPADIFAAASTSSSSVSHQNPGDVLNTAQRCPRAIPPSTGSRRMSRMLASVGRLPRGNSSSGIVAQRSRIHAAKCRRPLRHSSNSSS